MKNFVLDASIALAWCFADEATPVSIELLNNLEHVSAFAPTLWTLELGNILVMAERRGRITYPRISEYLALIEGLNIQIDRETHEKGFHEILILSRTEKLTTYDAAYLELAMRLGLPLASKDNQLCKAATRVGVEVLC